MCVVVGWCCGVPVWFVCFSETAELDEKDRKISAWPSHGCQNLCVVDPADELLFRHGHDASGCCDNCGRIHFEDEVVQINGMEVAELGVCELWGVFE